MELSSRSECPSTFITTKDLQVYWQLKLYKKIIFECTYYWQTGCFAGSVFVNACMTLLLSNYLYSVAKEILNVSQQVK